MSTASPDHPAPIDSVNRSLDATACDSLIFDEKQGLWFMMNRRHIKRVTRALQIGLVILGLALYVAAIMLDMWQPISTLSDWVRLIALVLLIFVLTWFVRRSISPARSSFHVRTDGLCRFPRQTHSAWERRSLSISCQCDAATHWIRVTLQADDAAFVILHAPISDVEWIAAEIEEWPWFIRERCTVSLPAIASLAPAAQVPKEPA